MKKNLIFIAATLLAVASMSACGVSAGQASYAPPAASSAAMARAETAIRESVEYDMAVEDAGGGKVNATMINTSDRMIVRTVNLSLETKEFDPHVGGIEEMTLGYGGFIEESYVQGKAMYERYGRRSANFTLRIPSEKLDAFVNDISGIFNVTDKRQSGSDITDSYYDSDARLKSLKTQEERLLAMLEQAGELEYLLQVEKELANVRYEIESITSSLLRMKNQVSMATIYLYIEETIEYTPIEPEPVTFGDQLMYALRGSVDTFKDFIQGAVIVLIWAFPFLLFLGIIAAVIIMIAVKSGKKRAKKFSGKSPAVEPIQIQTPETPDDGDNSDK